MKIDKNNENNQQETPIVYPFGWIIISISLVPILLGFMNNLTALIVGVIMLLIGGILLIIGKITEIINKKNIKKV